MLLLCNRKRVKLRLMSLNISMTKDLTSQHPLRKLDGSDSLLGKAFTHIQPTLSKLSRQCLIIQARRWRMLKIKLYCKDLEKSYSSLNSSSCAQLLDISTLCFFRIKIMLIEFVITYVKQKSLSAFAYLTSLTINSQEQWEIFTLRE